MLEANIFDNLNTSIYNPLDIVMGNTPIYNSLPILAPKARAQVFGYELWETGEQYTSSAVFNYPVQVGDVVQIMLPEKRVIITNSTSNTSQEVDNTILYLVTDVDEDNKATLQNYFWAMIEGIELPVRAFSGVTALDVFRTAVVQGQTNLMFNDSNLLSNLWNYPPRFNYKATSKSATEVCKDLFTQGQIQPTARIYAVREQYQGKSRTVYRLKWELTYSRANRTKVSQRVDFTLNYTTEDVVFTERSNYNTAYVWVNTGDQDNPVYDRNIYPEIYTLTNSGNLVNLKKYKSTSSNRDLPAQRFSKTLFYDEEPTEAAIRAEVTADTTIKRIYFDSDPKNVLYINDLVTLWVDGVSYSGSIVDRVITENGNRLTFLEGSAT